MKWCGSRATTRGTIGCTGNTSAGNTAGTTGKTVMMINKTIIATTIADKPAIAQFSETPASWPAFSETGRHQASQIYKNMKKLTIGTSLFSLLVGVMLSSCASDKAATESTTTTRQTTVTQPAATQTTTQTTRY